MKSYLWLVAMLAGLLIGAAGGWSVATMRAENITRNMLSSMATSEIVNGEIQAARAYLVGTPESAYNALQQLLNTYARYADWPEQYPGERAKRTSFAMAMTHGRLAHVCSRLGLLDESQAHLDHALKHEKINDEVELEKLLNLLDRAEQKQWNFSKE